MGQGKANEFYPRVIREFFLESFGESRDGEGQEMIQSTVFLLGEGIGGLGVEEGSRLRQEATAAAR